MDNNDLKIKIGSRIKELRTELGLTQDEFAKKIGVSGKTIVANYESGYSTPNDKVRLKICSICNCSMDYLTCQTDIRFSVAESKEKDEKFMAFWEEYKDLEDADKNILHATLMAIKARKGDK
jgi:transcriptional regulator with XRE-family HTH domain